MAKRSRSPRGHSSPIRTALDRHGEHFSTTAREAATAFAVHAGWDVPGELPMLLRLTEAFESFHAREWGSAEFAVRLRPTPAGRVERQAVLGRYGRAVARLRSRVFGTTAPPFDRPADALGWMRGLFERQEAAVDPTALEIGGERRPPDVAAEDWRARSLEAEALPIRWGTIPVTRIWARPGAYPLWPLAKLCHRIARVLELESGEIVRHVLTGVPPEFPPAHARGVVVRDDLGDQPGIAAPRVEVMVFTPELAFDELRELQRAVRAAWPTVDGGEDPTLEALDRGARRPTVTSADAEMSEIVHELGGEPGRGRRTEFWDDVREVWLGRGNEPVEADSLRRRWRRLQRKRPPKPEVPKKGRRPAGAV